MAVPREWKAGGAFARGRGVQVRVRMLWLWLWVFGAWALVAATEEPPRVLVLSSYHSGHYWQQAEIDGALSVLRRERPDVQIDVEYLDLVRFTTPAQKERIIPALLEKYGTNAWRVVMLFDQSGLEFGLKHREQLFPHTPVVFCGVEDFSEERAASMPDVTGVIERMDPGANARFALTLQPHLRRIVVVRGDPDSEGEVAAVESVLPFQGASPRVELFSGFNAQELFTHLETMPEDSVILFSGFSRAQDYIAEIERRAKVPIYPMQWPTYRGLGLGGVMVDAAFQGEDAAKMAVRILGGEPVASIPVQRVPRYRSVVDVQALRRFGIPESRVPAGCEFVNRPPTLWSEHRVAVLAVTGVFGALTALILGLLFVLRQKHRAERALVRSEGRFRHLVENSDDLVLELDDAGTVTYASPNSRHWLGLEPLALTGRRLEGLAPADAAHSSASRGNGAADRQVHRLRHADGSLRYMESSTRRGGHADVLVLRDVTARVQAEARRAEVEQQQRQAEKMQALGTLAGGIAHDLNNLLTPILGHASLLEATAADAESTEAVREIQHAGHRAAEVVKGILTFARAGKNTLEPVALAEVVEESRKLLRASLSSGVAIEVQCDPGLPPVLADRTRIGQVLLNLGHNAAHAMPHGGKLSIALHLRPVDDEFVRRHPPLKKGPKVVLEVSDTGCGMSAATLARVFEPFFTTKPPGQGTGLGLSVVLGIVQDHGGAIAVDSAEGRGTTVRIYFEPAEGAQAQVEARSEEATPGRGQRVLLVDDEPAVGRVGAAMLKRLGYEGELISDPGAVAARLADPALPPVELLITDLNMPGMDGRQLIRQVRAAHPQVKLILASGQEPDPAPDDLPVAFLPKPYGIRSLSEAVAKQLRS